MIDKWHLFVRGWITGKASAKTRKVSRYSIYVRMRMTSRDSLIALDSGCHY
jgi:hypothetical protein